MANNLAPQEITMPISELNKAAAKKNGFTMAESRKAEPIGTFKMKFLSITPAKEEVLNPDSTVKSYASKAKANFCYKLGDATLPLDATFSDGDTFVANTEYNVMLGAWIINSKEVDAKTKKPKANVYNLVMAYELA